MGAEKRNCTLGPLYTRSLVPPPPPPIPGLLPPTRQYPQWESLCSKAEMSSYLIEMVQAHAMLTMSFCVFYLCHSMIIQLKF